MSLGAMRLGALCALVAAAEGMLRTVHRRPQQEFRSGFQGHPTFLGQPTWQDARGRHYHGVMANGDGSMPWWGQWTYAIEAKEDALREAGLTCKDTSVYGANVPVLPKSLVLKVASMKAAQTEKRYNFNFQGTLSQNLLYDLFVQGGRRAWVTGFVRKHFGERDFLFDFGPTKENAALAAKRGFVKPYDHTADRTPLPEFETGKRTWDMSYFDTMIQSNFTLCPGGDGPWSMRFYEAILAGSIPVIDSVATDYAETGKAYWFRHIGYHYLTTEEALSRSFSSAKLKRMADANYRKLIEYQTFMDGDVKVPKPYAHISGPCLSDRMCARDCPAKA